MVCCGETCCSGPKVCRHGLIITAIVLGIFDLVTDWLAFGVFATGGFRSSPLGEFNRVVFIIWLVAIVPGTILGIVDLIVKIVRLRSGGYEVEKTKTNGKTDRNLKKDLLFTSSKVIFEDGCNSVLGYYILFAACRVKLSPPGDGDVQVEFWLLLVSWISSALSTLVSICQMTSAVSGKWWRFWDCDYHNSQHKCTFRIARLCTGIVTLGCISLASAAILIYSLNGIDSPIIQGKEVSVYLDLQSSPSNGASSTLLANFSDIYSSGDAGLKRYIDRGEQGCYVYHLKFDKDSHVVLFNQGVFLRNGTTTINQYMQNQTRGVDDYSTCHGCPDRDNMGNDIFAPPQNCNQQSGTLLLVLEEDVTFQNQNTGNSKMSDNFQGQSLEYCIGAKSRLGRYSSSIAACSDASSMECNKKARRVTK